MKSSRLQRRAIVGVAALTMLMSVLVVAPATPVAAASTALADFETGVPTGWFEFAGGGASVSTAVVVVGDADPLAKPDQVGDNAVLEATFDVSVGFAGFGDDFSISTGAQDWINFTGVSFWMYGTGSGNTYQFEIMDNRSDPATDTAERFDTLFSDDFIGWQHVVIPFTDFTRAVDFQPGGAPDDGLTLTEMWGWAVPLDGNAGTLTIDDVALDAAVVDDFENGLPSGVDADGNPIGFFTFSDPNSGIGIATTDSPTEQVPGAAATNHVLQMDSDVNGDNGFAGFIHAFENEAVDTWVPQDWSGFTGVSFWLYGNNTGSILFLDILDNRADGTTTDTAERWSTDIIDDFSGWQLLEIPFESLNRKEIGNGAPNDGLTLTAVHGWAFGVFDSGVPFTNYIDDLTLFGVADVPELALGFSANSFDIEEGTTGDITVKLNRALNEDDPAQVSVDYSFEAIVAEPGRDFVEPAPGTLTFVNGGASELTFSIDTIDDDKWEPTERIIMRLSNPVDVAPGFIMQASADIVDNDLFDPLLIDDFEQGTYLWDSSPSASVDNPEIAAGDAAAIPGQGAFESVLGVSTLSPDNIRITGRICNEGTGAIRMVIQSTDTFDATTIDHRTVQLGNAFETHVDKRTGEARRHVAGDNLVFHFRFQDTGLECDPEVIPVSGLTFDGDPIVGHVWQDFAIGQDWSATDGMEFWYYGSGSGDEVTVTLKDNRSADPGPAGWDLVWADEFNEPAGTAPNPDNWGYEIGDGTVNGIPGWGNGELQYYTDSPENVATDGAGNLVITAQEADGSLTCYYGPCEYTSARLVTTNRAEFAYGKIESRVQVPSGPDGLWPAFWSLGTDIDLVEWPQTGEIDIMEYVSRIPTEIFGTIHGPGYAGGSAYGNTYDFGEPVSNDFHTFTIEWQPDRIDWYVDGILYHTATSDDIAPNEWVFNDPVYLLLNMAIGGNFGGALSEDLTFPQSMTVDYVRVYQGPDTAERFEASFVDDAAGWRQVSVPFTDFARSAAQPAGAPNDGLGLTEVWGYGFGIEDITTSSEFMVDQVHLMAPSEVTVTNASDSGAGSLRSAIAAVATGGTVTFDPSLAGGTIALTSGPLAAGKSVVIDGSDVAGLAINGGLTDRVLIVEAGAFVHVNDLTLSEGYGFQLAGCVLNNGNLTLDHVTVTGCVMTTDAGDFWQGGGGIYSGDGATLHLIDSTVSNNTADWSGGGLYGYFNSTTTIERSTISGNVSGDVGGGIRSLGNATIINSTISGNEATGWYGGALFMTDGVIDMINTTVTDNVSPDFGPAAVFVGTFGDSEATLNVANSIIANNNAEGCFLAPFGAGAVAINSLGGNVFSDSTCFAGVDDQTDTDPLLGALADNGGPTLTHALMAGSPAIDSAGSADCPATDQRGETRDGACDAGAFEYIP